MKKFLSLMAILLVILVVLLNFVLPTNLANILEEQIVHATGAQEVDVSLSSSPNIRIAIGEIDKIHGTAGLGRIGDIYFKNLTVDGENLRLDVLEILFPTKKLTEKERISKIFKYADKIDMHGTITEEELKNFIALKVDKIENADVKIKPEGVTASGQVKIMGRTADIDLAGNFIVDNGDVYFRMTNLNVRNTLVRHIQLDRFFGDIKILESTVLPLGFQFDSVEMREGEAVLSAIHK